MRTTHLLIIIIFMSVLFSASASAQDAAGCCCDPNGRAQKSSILTPDDCDIDAGFTFQKPEDEFFFGKSIDNICAEFCGVSVGGEIVAPEIGCGSPEVTPQPDNIRVSPIKGEAKVRLSWDQNCSSFVNSITISRCEGEDCRGGQEIAEIPVANSFLDPSELEFGKVYTYKLKTEFTYGDSEEASAIGGPGDIECKGLKSARTFCGSPLYYENFRDYFQTFGYKEVGPGQFAAQKFNETISQLFFNRFNKALSCDDLNKVFTKKTCPDDKGDICIVDRSAPSGARCASSTDCQLLSPNNFGLTFTEEICEGGLDQKNFCFLDRSRSIADQCFNCIQGMSCYDYRSERACNQDNCGAGSCQWRPVFSEIGIGVCVDTRFDNCRLCTSKGTPGLANREAFNEIFDQCTQAKATALSTDQSQCFFDPRTGTAAGCADVDCTGFNQEQCGSPPGGIKLGGDNSIISRSSDSCGIGVCQFDPTVGCAKNADGESPDGDFRDCAGLEGNNLETCEKDRYPPETQLIAVRNSKGVVEDIQIVRRDKEEENQLPKKTSSRDAPTFFCVGGGCTDFQEYTQDKLFVDNTFLQKIGEGSKPEIFAILQEGENTISYFTQDKHKNKEIVKQFTFRACSSCMGPRMLNASVSNSRIREEVYFTRDASPTIEIFFNKDVQVVNSEIVRGELRQGVQASPQGTIARFIPSAPLGDGEYTLVVDAASVDGVKVDEPVTVEFVVDTTPPVITVIVNNNATPGAIVRSPSAQIQLNISEEVDILEAFLESKNFTRFVTKSITTNITGQFRGGRGTVSATVSPPEGESIFTIKAEDFAGHPAQVSPHPFRIYTGPPKIRLVSPSFEVAPDFVFPIEIETQNPAECRFWFNTNKPPIPPPTDFSALEQFDLTGFTNHVKNDVRRIEEEEKKFPLLVRCQDELGSESSEVFELRVDTTPPSIISAVANPNPVIQKPFKTTLKVQTDDETFCKASKSSTSYSAMELTFPGFEEAGARVHQLDVEEEEVRRYTYNVACINLAELGPAKETIQFQILEGEPFVITSNTPRYVKEMSFNLAIETNKDASCFYADDPNSAGERLGETEELSMKHVTPVTVPQEGTFSFFVRCSTGGATVIGGEPEFNELQVNVTVDSTPPTMTSVNDDSPLFENKEISYFQDHIRAKWLGEDLQSGVQKYLYSVKDMLAGGIIVAETPSDKEDYYVDIYFDVQDKAKYQVEAKAVNGVGDESSPMSSDGVTIDFAKEPIHCVNGVLEPEFGEIDTDCSGECYKCKANQRCEGNQDCVSDFCEQGICQEALCDDGIKNGRETDVDCGGQCGDCSIGKKCFVDRDCGTRYCSEGGTCEKAPPCDNKILDGTETDVDCGGACPNKCGSGKHCQQDSDCKPGILCYEQGESGVKKCLGEDELPDRQQQEKDEDGDSLPDWYEEKYGIDDPDEDADGDGLTNREEYQYYLRTGREISPILIDTDGDGWSDLDEITMGYNPVNSEDFPESRWWKFLAIVVGLIGFGLVAYYGYQQYQEYQKAEAERLANMPRRKKKVQEVPVDHQKNIAERADKIKKMFTKKKQEFMDLAEVGESSKKEAQKKEKRHEEVFSQLSDVRQKKRVSKPARRSVIGDLRSMKKETAAPTTRKDQTFGKLSLLGKMKGMSPDEKQKVAEKLKRLSGGKASPDQRKKLLSDLKMTAGYYKENKDALAKKADEWMDLKTKVDVESKKKGNKKEKEE